MSIASLLCSSVLALAMPRSEYACRHMDTLVKEATANDIEPEILIALIHEESRWKPWAESKAGACGLTQVLPRYTKPRKKCKDLKKPRVSISVGALALNYWVYEYADGDYLTGLCGYNGGYNCPTLLSSKAYARRIMRMAKRLTAEVESQRAYHILMESLRLQFNVSSPTK